MKFTATTSCPLGRSSTARLARGFCALLLPAAFAASALAVSEPSLITGEKKNYEYSWQQERQLGAEADQEVVNEMGVYDDPQLQAYVQAVGERVLGQTEFANPNAPEIYRNTKFTFRVVDSPVVNAFAVPGGYVYVTRGLLSHLENEAQLAVVLGHEIGHVAARHSSQQARRAKWGQLGAIAAAVLGEKVLGEAAPNIAPAIAQASGKALQMFMLRYSRDAENESDQLGVRYAAHAGYQAAESARLFQTLKEMSTEEGKALPTWQSTHPDPGDRAQRVVQLAAAASPGGQANNVGADEYLRHIQNLVVGDDPREGFAENGVFYHPVLRFQLPIAQGWKLENQRAAVIFAEPNGEAMMGLRLASGQRAREAAAQFAQQNKVQVTASGDTSVHGLPASVIVGKASTEQGDVGVWNAFIEMDGHVYSLLGYAPTATFERVRPTFESVAAGFAPLQLPANLEVQPARLRIVRADRSGPFASFVPASLPPELSANAVAHMNQVKIDQNVPEGATLKIPEAPARPSMAGFANTSATSAGAASQPQAYPGTNQPPYGSGPYPQQGSYPPSQTQTQTQTGYPPQQQGQPQSYPPTQSPYPQGPSQTNYPNSGYPQAGNPQSYPSQGSQGAPQSSPYPSSSGYPNSQTYPQNYPQQQSYPQNYPQQSYPPSNYPPQGTQGYPSTGGYPQQPAPSTQPRWPQPGTQQTQQQPQQQQPRSQQQGPVWPR